MSEFKVVEAPGLPANWINGWLAAIGVTVLVPAARLAWVGQVVPWPAFRVPEARDLLDDVALALPTVDQVEHSAIARHHSMSKAELGRSVPFEVFAERAAIERLSKGYLLGSTLTDCVKLDSGPDLPHSPFDPPMPKGITIAERAVACAERVPEQLTAALAATFAGRGQRVQTNGLGFCPRRGDAGVDPVVELLVFAALALFPVRGDGSRQRPRAWVGPPSRRGSFEWFTWDTPLDRWGIDALLDIGPGVGALRWRTVPYQPRSSLDSTRAYFSEPVS